MGAVTFEVLAFGKTADDAFRNAVEDAKDMHGHGGYTGTIAEKSRLKPFPNKSTRASRNVDTHTS